MPRLPLMLAGLLLAACATAPAEPEPVVEAPQPGVTERYGPLIEEAANTLAAAEPPGAAPAGLRISILSVEEIATGLFYTAELHTSARRRGDQDYVIYGQCPADDIASCASQIVAGARMLVKPGAR